mmetsp:Transcript_27650/g.58423  ORF Transcript_27650/g.58423 Transcript_27650/m.58423 type:complete len:125 (-) Transcript_27650:566-940(-)
MFNHAASSPLQIAFLFRMEKSRNLPRNIPRVQNGALTDIVVQQSNRNSGPKVPYHGHANNLSHLSRLVQRAQIIRNNKMALRVNPKNASSSQKAVQKNRCNNQPVRLRRYKNLPLAWIAPAQGI